MKNINHLLILVLVFVFTACSLEPYELPDEELYTRAFIKKFGLIDQNQTWNMAQSTSVTVKPLEHADLVKVYAKSNGRYYLTAEITDVNSTITIPIDVPQSVEDLKVVIDGNNYFTTIGGTVEADRPASRTFLGNVNHNVASVGSNITITEAPRKYFAISDVFQLFSTLPESADYKYDEKYPGNLTNTDIITDFMLHGRGTDVVIYPIYWNTLQTHTLGVYYVKDKGTASEEVVRIPFYTMRKSPEFENITLKPTSTITWGDNLLIDGTASDNNNTCYFYKTPVTEDDGATYTYPVNTAVRAVAGGWYCWSATTNGRVNYDYDSQFIIHLPDGVDADPNKNYKVVMNIRADVAASGIPTQTQHDFWDYFGSGIGTVDFPADSWQEVSFTGKFTTSGSFTDFDAIVFNLGAYNGTNTFYFNNIRWYEETGVEYNIKSCEENYRPASQGAWQYTWRYLNTSDALDHEETKSASADLSDAHLLVSKTDGGELLCPLADVLNVNRTSAYEYSLTDPSRNQVEYVASKGIAINVPEGMRFGFYIEFKDKMYPYDDKIIYSDIDGNIKYQNRVTFAGTSLSLDINNQQHRSYATFCSMFTQTISRATKYTYLTFEDWTPNSNGTTLYNGDYDLNDLAFLIEGVTDDDIDETEKTFQYLICAEDLGVMDDFDFNDIIVGVDIITRGTGAEQKKYVTFTGLAAGGTLPLYLYCNGTLLYPEGKSSAEAEWHNWFDEPNYTRMINTYNTSPYRVGHSCTVEVSTDFTLENFGRISDSNPENGINGITIKVGSQSSANDVHDPTKDKTITPPWPGEAPQMFLITDEGKDQSGNSRNWQWPAERQPIYQVYPRFSTWAESNTDKDWYKDIPLTGYYTNRTN